MVAVEFAIICDGCGARISASRRSARAARAEAELEHGAISSGAEDLCKRCRLERQAELSARMAAGVTRGHSIDGRQG